MKKIVAIVGSPRLNGNSATLARKVMDTAETLGASSQTFNLYTLEFRGCVACMACKQKADECVLCDDLTDALEAVREADILILASPVYFGDVTGEMKCFIDRMYSLMTPEYLTGGNPSRLAPGKKCLMILTQGYPGEERFGEAYGRYAQFLGPGWFGYEMHQLRGLGLRMPDDAAANVELLAQAEALGRQLMA
jgi:multimeric flavodoxin WrbA